MSRYKHIFFDLDHTLWDFDKNCSATLFILYDQFELRRFEFLPEHLIEKYKLVNNRMWDDYNNGKITKLAIRNERFKLTFRELGLDEREVPEKIDEEFIRLCPAQGHLMPYVHEVLSYLYDKYELHIITNGFKESQHIKLNTTNIQGYFKEIINSEACGFLKPDRKIFEYALNKTNSDCSECIMIGDDLKADVLGAKNAGMDHVYYNPKEKKHEEQIQYEVKCLSELKKII